MATKGSRQTHCKNGHPRIPENLFANNSCKECAKTSNKQWRDAHPEQVQRYARRRDEWRTSHPDHRKDYWLQSKYGISQADYERMLAEQNGQCAICFRLMDKPKVDHNHETGEVRQLLCNECNCGIGFLREDTILVASALKYLEKWSL